MEKGRGKVWIQKVGFISLFWPAAPAYALNSPGEINWIHPSYWLGLRNWELCLTNSSIIFWVSDFAGTNRRVGSKNNFIYNNTVFIPSVNPVTGEAMSPEILIRENTEETYVYNNLIVKCAGYFLVL